MGLLVQICPTRRGRLSYLVVKNFALSHLEISGCYGWLGAGGAQVIQRARLKLIIMASRASLHQLPLTQSWHHLNKLNVSPRDSVVRPCDVLGHEQSPLI